MEIPESYFPLHVNVSPFQRQDIHDLNEQNGPSYTYSLVYNDSICNKYTSIKNTYVVAFLQSSCGVEQNVDIFIGT